MLRNLSQGGAEQSTNKITLLRAKKKTLGRVHLKLTRANNNHERRGESALPVVLGAFALKIPKKSFEELSRTK